MTTVTTQAVLFDLDGTLIDSEEYWIRAETALLAKYGKPWSHAQAMQLVGRSLDQSGQILQDYGIDLPVPEIIAALTAMVHSQMVISLPWRPGARELLAQLRSHGVPTALVTMSPMSIARNVADRAGSELGTTAFDALITGDTVARGKPAPDPYLSAAERLGVPPQETAAVEDSPTGLASAVAAGTAAVAVPNLISLPESDGYTIWATLVDRGLRDFDELIQGGRHRA